ncbi:hypothetical protein [Actinoplanes sp. NPDC026619]|uniref:hypothetical protein n=1 Tax=Actinoplanes sp. NPDC026619 TaxID=3155798 RepID=UPI0033CA1AC5
MSNQFEERLSAMERRVALEAELRAKVDKDLSDLESGQRGLTRLIEAVRGTQVEQGALLNLHTTNLNLNSALLTDLNRLVVEQQQTLSLHSVQLEQLDTKVFGMDAKVSGLDAKVSGLDAKVSGLDAKVSGLESKLDRVLELLEPPPAPAPAN